MTMRALVRPPSPRLSEGLISHIERSEIDYRTAERQWHGYVAAMQGHGWSTIEVPRVDDCPDGVFIEDSMLVFADLAVIARSGAVRRRDELPTAEQAVRDQGYRIERITEPATLDGGDVLKIGTTIYVGIGGRTNAAAVDQLGAILAPLGANVVSVPVTKVLHLKSAVTALPDGTVIGYPPIVDDTAAFPTFLPVPEEPGSHVVLLDDEHLLMAESAPRTAELLEQRGYQPVVVDITEFEKLEGCVTCLSVRLRG